MAIMYPSSMPYDDLTFHDLSEYTETTPLEPVAGIPDGPIALMPFISPKGYGEDNKLMYMDSTRLSKYGDPNLKKYGLSLYLAKRFVEGGGTVLGMRLMPNDAGYANKVIYATISDSDIVKYENKSVGTWPNQVVKYYPVWSKGEEELTFDSITLGTSDGYVQPYVHNVIITDIKGKNYKIANVDPENKDKDNITIDKPKAGSDGKILIPENKYYNVKLSDSDSDSTSIVVIKEVINEKDSYSIYSVNVITSGDAVTSVELKEVIATLVSEKRSVIKYSGAMASSTTSDNPASSIEGLKKWEPEEAVKTVTTTGGTKDVREKYPVFVVKAKAKGDFAKSFKFKITADTTMNSHDSNYFFYKFNDSDNGAKLDETMTFTFNDDYIYGSDCLSIEDIFGTYSSHVEMVKSDLFDEFKTAVKEKITLKDDQSDDAKEAAFNKMDILFGSNTAQYGIIVDFNKCNFSNPEENQLSGENLNGTFDDTGIDAAAPYSKFGDAENVIDPYASLFKSVYDGSKDDLIYDEVRFPYEYILVPSYDASVIQAVEDLIANRHITRAYWTYPKFDSYSDARAWADANMAAANTFKSSDYCEWAQIKDPYTNKKTFMPSTYFNAYGLPYHWTHNKGKPYAGTRNYRWTGFIVGTLTPHSTNPNEYIANHNKGLNTMIEDGLGYASGYEQITSLQRAGKTSQLSENNNATILMNMARIALSLASDARWTTLGDDEINSFISNVENTIALSLTGTYKSLKIEGQRESVNGAGRNRIHCKFYINFNDMLKGVTYEFYILAN